MRHGVFFAVSLLLAGCQTLPPRPAPVQSWEARCTQLEQRARYAFNGRVAVATGKEGFNAHLRWTQDGARSELLLNGPFGAGGVQVEFERGQLTVRDAQGRELGSDAAHAQLMSHLGFEPPFESLKFWVLGIPDPSVRAGVLLDEQQRLTHLLQNDWRIDYGEYRAVQDEWLPRRLTLQHGDVRVRVLIETWQP